MEQKSILDERQASPGEIAAGRVDEAEMKNPRVMEN